MIYFIKRRLPDTITFFPRTAGKGGYAFCFLLTGDRRFLHRRAVSGGGYVRKFSAWSSVNGNLPDPDLTA
jgi:hypothetical protein